MPKLEPGSKKYQLLQELFPDPNLDKLWTVISKRNRDISVFELLFKAMTSFDINLVAKIATLALEMPQLFSQPIIKLESGYENCITLTQHQCACILANFFFGNFSKNEEETKRFPGMVNFNKYVNVNLKNEIKMEFC
jgi:hypothetical protein